MLVAKDCFPGSDINEILEYLDLYGVEPYERERERVQLAILRLSKGNLEKLLEFIDMAKKDYRDALLWAESYPLDGG